jgi:hypothetical protein
MRLNPQQVGRLIAAAGAKTLKRINLELRGKTSMIVFNDAPLASDPPGFGRGVTTFCRPDPHCTRGPLCVHCTHLDSL